MKKIFWMLAICASLGLMSPFAHVIKLQAQTPQTPTPSPAAAKGPCTDENKTAWYADFTKFRTSDAAKAYEAGKKYLTACPQEDGPIPTYLKKWVAAYEKESRKLKFQPLLYNEKKYPEALALGKEILAEDPENLRVIIDLGWGSYLAAAALKNESLTNDAVTYAKKAIQLIESGKSPESWAPFKSKEDTLAYLYNAIGRIAVKTNPTEALNALIKSAQYDTEIKKDPWTYYFIAASYETGPYATLSAAYEKYKGKDETPESKLALENINQVVDRMIDAYARAVAAAGNDPKYQASKKEWMDGLSTWYKYRHNQSDAGLNEMIASVLSKPLPPVPTPLTSLPASTPSSTTPVSGNSSTAGSASAPAPSVGPATNKTTTTPTATSLTTTPKTTTTAADATSTKPATTTTTTATKPKPKNNHRRH
jgi:tetratricopeptide (TPR) repeat protein